MKGDILAIVLGILIAGGIVTAILIPVLNNHRDLCREYCNCSVSKDCPYTFDYNKVKNCECEK